MSLILTDSRYYSDIADAIRAAGGSGRYSPGGMAAAIGSLSGGIHYEKGTFSYHTGTDRMALNIPLEDDSFRYYFVRVTAVNSWKKIGGEWVEQSGRDFTETETTTKWVASGFCFFLPFLTTEPCIASNGTTVSSSGLSSFALRTNVYSGGSQNVSQAFSAAPSISKNGFSASMNTNYYLCTTKAGQTFSYEIWGWNNE